MYEFYKHNYYFSFGNLQALQYIQNAISVILLLFRIQNC